METREIDRELNWRICAHYFPCVPSFFLCVCDRTAAVAGSLSVPFSSTPLVYRAAECVYTWSTRAPSRHREEPRMRTFCAFLSFILVFFPMWMHHFSTPPSTTCIHLHLCFGVGQSFAKVYKKSIRDWKLPWRYLSFQHFWCQVEAHIHCTSVSLCHCSLAFCLRSVCPACSTPPVRRLITHFTPSNRAEQFGITSISIWNNHPCEI